MCIGSMSTCRCPKTCVFWRHISTPTCKEYRNTITYTLSTILHNRSFPPYSKLPYRQSRSAAVAGCDTKCDREFVTSYVFWENCYAACGSKPMLKMFYYLPSMKNYQQHTPDPKKVRILVARKRDVEVSSYWEKA